MRAKVGADADAQQYASKIKPLLEGLEKVNHLLVCRLIRLWQFVKWREIYESQTLSFWAVTSFRKK